MEEVEVVEGRMGVEGGGVTNCITIEEDGAAVVVDASFFSSFAVAVVVAVVAVVVVAPLTLNSMGK